MQCQGQPAILRPAPCSLLTTGTEDVLWMQALWVNCLSVWVLLWHNEWNALDSPLSGAPSQLSAALLHFVPQEGKP